MMLAVVAIAGLAPTAVPAQQTTLAEQQANATAEIHEYFRRTAHRLSDAALADVQSLDDWERLRPLLRRQLLEMLGLAPLPDRTELNATVTCTIEYPEFVVEKLHFQSRPGLYVTANFYRPKQVEKPLPTILYLCGHGNVKIDGVSYGSKADYQHHPAWFAREGYCCLILDTLQLGEIEGLHHGTYREGMWWWLSRGYTPAGVEAWNAVRALDYLETRPEVDMKRIGVTGRSGGGAYTWWLAAIDDRPACLVPVAGITDLENHIIDGCIEGHCDCMYMVNTYGWDFATLAALAAPRPLLFSNSDKDTIFPLTGVVRTHAKLKRIYDLHNATDKLGLLITEGPHKDTQELQVPAFRWMNRWLQGRDEPIRRVADKPLDPKQLKVFHELPADQRNTTVQEWFVPAADMPPAPKTLEEWESLRVKLLAELKAKSFRGWPQAPPALAATVVSQRELQGLNQRRVEFTSEENLRLAVCVLTSTQVERPRRIQLTVSHNDAWTEQPQLLGLAVSDSSSLAKHADAVDAQAVGLTARALKDSGMVLARFAPRGTGPNQWNPDKKKDTQIQRRFALLGKTADDGRVWDVCRAIEALQSIDELKQAKVTLRGTGPLAGVALYAAIFSANVDETELMPAGEHLDVPCFLNALRIVDMPQSVAMLLPRKVTIWDTTRDAWQWTEQVARLYDAQNPPIQFKSSQPPSPQQ
jgi:cephalosporin-C deacetylase-like acetyl esterase